jgi:glycosyltransferase involved in cell wall biosynthesis
LNQTFVDSAFDDSSSSLLSVRPGITAPWQSLGSSKYSSTRFRFDSETKDVWHRPLETYNMRRPVLTIFYQFDPWHSTIGGIQTLIGSFIKYAPVEIDLRLVGLTSDRQMAVGQWHRREWAGRELLFMPLFYLQNDDVRHLIPTTLKYLLALLKLALLRVDLASDFMHFHRLEPTLAARHWLGHKTLFVHNDLTRQFANAGGKQAILWRRFPALYYGLERLLIQQFAQVLSCNSQALIDYQQRYPQLAQRFGYVHNSVDTEIFYPVPDAERDLQRRRYAQQRHLAEQTRFVLFAGRLHPQKDPLLLIRAFAQLTELDMHLLVVGDGELASQVRLEIARLGQTQRISMLGRLSRAQVAHLHRMASVCVLTSEFEGLPLVVLEALACGTPVVTTSTGDTPQLLTPQSGVVCAQRTPEKIAGAIQTILQQSARFPAAACLQVAQPFAAPTVIGRIYDDLLACWHQQTQPCPVQPFLKTSLTTPL